MCIWEHDVIRWCHSLHARPVHLQRTCNSLRLVAIMHNRARKRKQSSWNLGSWNVRSMVTEGPVEIARSRGDRGDDREVDLIMQEMRRYNVKVTALQKTKWFGMEVYRVPGSVVLTSGREKPAHGDTVKRGEGVAIVLTDWAIGALKAAGRQWNVWSSRAVSACL